MSLECPCCGSEAFAAGQIVDDGQPGACGCLCWASFDAESSVAVAWDDEQPCPVCDLRPIWLDGPDSEAARAARGGFPHMTPEQEIAVWQEWARANSIGLPESDPAHTPAVRQVVAWETLGALFDSPDDAYLEKAEAMVADAWSPLRREKTWGEWREHWPGSRVERLAAYLRHRDEKEGHR